jgi:hypothetical protein
MTQTTNDNLQVLGQIPTPIREELFGAYNRILQNFRERRWEPSELNGGKLCEIVYTIIRGHIDGTIPDRSQKPRNMVDACHQLEQLPSAQFPRSIRIQIPRMLVALYEIRSNRGVGHSGGDVDPNEMDAACVVQMSKWLMAELVRIFHDVDTETASKAISSIVQKSLPIVWKIGDKLRVLDISLSYIKKTLVLLYHSSTTVSEKDLFHWVEHSNASAYRRDVLRKAHREKLLEYDASSRTVQISPIGISLVERDILGQ